MATLDWTCEAIDGVTLVELVVTGERAQRVSIESNLTPVWPPRRQGRPVAGWDGSTFEDELGDGRLVVGYASPAEPVEPPAELTTEPPDDDGGIDPQDVIRALGDGGPPRDAVPADRSVPDEPTATANSPSEAGGPPEAGRESPSADHGAERRAEPLASRGDASTESATVSPAIEAYFDALDRRIAAAERLADPETVDQAREAVTAAGGIEAVEGLDRQIQADRARLERLTRRQQALADRLDAVEIPVERLERLT